MTSVTLATHPTPKLVSGIIGFLSPDPKAPWVWDMVGYLASSLPYLSSKDVSGYAFFSSNITGPDGNNGTASYAGMGGLFTVIMYSQMVQLSASLLPCIIFFRVLPNASLFA